MLFSSPFRSPMTNVPISFINWWMKTCISYKSTKHCKTSIHLKTPHTGYGKIAALSSSKCISVWAQNCFSDHFSLVIIVNLPRKTLIFSQAHSEWHRRSDQGMSFFVWSTSCTFFWQPCRCAVSASPRSCWSELWMTSVCPVSYRSIYGGHRW